MRLLLDTHAFIWWVLGDSSLSRSQRPQSGMRQNQVFVSAASVWEVPTKHRLGRLPQAAPLAADFPRTVVAQGFIPLAITMRDGARAGLFAAAHRDPFDRMLVAQSLLEQMPIISSDTALDQFGIVRG